MSGKSNAGFDWDEGNASHIAKHKIAQSEAEEIVLGGGSILIESEDRSGEDRYVELGKTGNGRLLIVVWTWRQRKIRVVTAFPANRKWHALWKRIRGGHDA